MGLKAVIFDLDGVLTDTVEAHYQSWARVCREEGIPFSRQTNEKLLGLTRQRSLEVILDGRALPEAQMQELLRRKNEYYLESVACMGPEHLLPGVARLLGEIQDSGLRAGVASASRNAGPILRQLGADQWMDAICDGSLIQRSKPAPDVYLRVASELEVEPKECLALEDSEAGVQSAISAGMCVVGLGPVDRLFNSNALFPDLSNVRLDDLQAVYDRWCEPRSI